MTGTGTPHHEAPDKGKATMLAMILVADMRRRLRTQGMELTPEDVDTLRQRVTALPDTIGVIATLDHCAKQGDTAGALAWILATEDPAGSKYASNDRPAKTDVDTLAVGLVARMKALGLRSDDELERDMMQIEQEHDPAYLHGVLLDAVDTIHAVLGIQLALEQRRDDTGDR